MNQSERIPHIIIIAIITLLASFLPASAQDAAGDFATFSSSDIYYPVPLPEQPTFTPSRSQKGVSLSTDIIAIGMPLATLAGVCIIGDWEGLRQGIYTAGVTSAATLILKFSISERRPNLRNYHSFPSGHTSASFATATFLQRRYGWKFGVPAYTLATYVGWGRVFSKSHHWWDVAAGAAIGTLSAYLFTTPWARSHDFQAGVWTTDSHHGVAASFSF
ncbi:MAG: phosphatase PAP2 family protein [Muribaculaceae bacterium]|nr:phosphatase PAP2 family protein [Muribaculaceae bacterium]